MTTRLKIARIAIPAILIGLTLVFVVATVAALHAAVAALLPAPGGVETTATFTMIGDTETVGTFILIGLMSAVCAWGTGVIAKASIDDVRRMA